MTRHADTTRDRIVTALDVIAWAALLAALAVAIHAALTAA
jgi:hypothetical protein